MGQSAALYNEALGIRCHKLWNSTRSDLSIKVSCWRLIFLLSGCLGRTIARLKPVASARYRSRENKNLLLLIYMRTYTTLRLAEYRFTLTNTIASNSKDPFDQWPGPPLPCQQSEQLWCLALSHTLTRQTMHNNWDWGNTLSIYILLVLQFSMDIACME